MEFLPRTSVSHNYREETQILLRFLSFTFSLIQALVSIFDSQYNTYQKKKNILFLNSRPTCLFVQTASAGLGFLQFCNLNSFRTKFILGFSLFVGLSVPQYFKEYELVAGYGPVHTRTQSVRSISYHANKFHSCSSLHISSCVCCCSSMT